jgi:hypothetical protein
VFKFCQNWKTCYELKTLLRVNKLSHFLTNSQVNMLDFVGPHKRWLLEGVLFEMHGTELGGGGGGV